MKPPSYVPNRQEVVLDIRKTVGGAICDPEDIIEDVLDDNDFISIGILSTQIREQMSGPDLHVFTVKFLALNKTGFPPVKDTSQIFFNLYSMQLSVFNIFKKNLN